MSDHGVLRKKAELWARHDVDDATRAWVLQRLQERDWRKLRSAFDEPLSFGTAGLRGRVGAGPACMNLATVSKASWGLAQFLKTRSVGVATPSVIIGHDARPESATFARRAAGVLAASGVSVILSAGWVATPVVAFAVRHLAASAAAVVTASHNPRGDNGFKVFDDLGVQIVSPWDTEIARLMASSPGADRIPCSEVGISSLPDDVLRDYYLLVRATAATFSSHLSSPNAALRIAYTPLHGVGGRFIEEALAKNPSPVAVVMPDSQRHPDGSFPTTPFPNPEEPGALDELVETMNREGIDIGMANDPDADRFSLCLRVEDHVHRLSGDALGLLFADACWSRPGTGRTVVSTVVSSPGLDSLAERHGGKVVRTLTGFKWLCRAALDEPDFAFAYEEALGYCFGAPPGLTSVMDKDGICAAAVMSEMLVAEGGASGLFQRLRRIYDEIGFWESHGRSLRFSGEAGEEQAHALVRRLRDTPPRHLGKFDVGEPLDFLLGSEMRGPYLGKSNLLSFELETSGGADEASWATSGKLLVRPSGTEPKLKFYIHLCSKLEQGKEYLVAATRQSELADGIFEDLRALASV